MHTHSDTYTLSLSLTHTHTHTHALSLSHTHTHTVSLSLSLSLSLHHHQNTQTCHAVLVYCIALRDGSRLFSLCGLAKTAYFQFMQQHQKVYFSSNWIRCVQTCTPSHTPNSVRQSTERTASESVFHRITESLNETLAQSSKQSRSIELWQLPRSPRKPKHTNSSACRQCVVRDLHKLWRIFPMIPRGTKQQTVTIQ